MVTPLNQPRTGEHVLSVIGVRVASAIGFAISIGVLILVGWIAPDDGATGISVRQAVALAVVFMAAPIAAWIGPRDPVNLVVVGGGWVVAGAATMMGGNVLMAVAIPYGFLVLSLGAAQRPPLTTRVVGRLLAIAVALIFAVGFAIGTGVLTGIGAFVLAAAVAGSAALGSGRAGRRR